MTTSTTATTVVRGPHRRAVSISALSGVVAFVAYNTLQSAWYLFTLSTDSLTLPKGFIKAGSVYATASYDAFSLTAPGTANGPMGPQAALGAIEGMPTPMVWLFGACIAVFFGALVRSTPIALLGIICANMARSAIETMRVNVENPSYGGLYMHPTQGLATFSLTTLLMIAVCLLVTVQVFATNRSERAARRLAGEHVPSMFEHLSVFQNSVASRAARAAETREHSNV